MRGKEVVNSNILNWIFRPFCKEGEKAETKQKRLEAKYAALQLVPNIEKLGTAKQAQVKKAGILKAILILICFRYYLSLHLKVFPFENIL